MFITFFSISLAILCAVVVLYKTSSKYLVGDVSTLETKLNYTDKEYKSVKKARFIPCRSDMYLMEEYIIPDATTYDSLRKKERMY
jgi:hypothetical protein